MCAAGGIGIFLAFIGLQNSEGIGLVTYNSATLVTLGEQYWVEVGTAARSAAPPAAAPAQLASWCVLQMSLVLPSSSSSSLSAACQLRGLPFIGWPLPAVASPATGLQGCCCVFEGWVDKTHRATWLAALGAVVAPVADQLLLWCCRWLPC